ncbi:hypothetical protein GCM10025866_25630 [Naasia aerilata]|uniref:DNA replication/recombination mediator RecO N-terminal domain-containing protein n=1 Tax=Naasia aerilata TaxID=1162966 RepID=A0ABM8GED9_9MICO|nr:hypothetical protein GCM10025866_25630 [Naasia aerilata]
MLRTHKLGEADRIVTLLSRQHGKIRAVAKGVRRTSSKFGARLEPFMVVDVQLYEGRSLDTITQAESLASYGADIAADYGAFTAANVMVETADKLTEGRSRCSSTCCSWAPSGPCPATSTARASLSTPICCAPSRSQAGRRASTTARSRARRGRTAPSWCSWAGWSPTRSLRRERRG